MVPSRNIQGGFKFMILITMKNITRKSWYIIPMPDKFIYRLNILVKYKQEILVFTYNKGRLIGDGDFDITVVDGGGDENEVQLKIENDNDLAYQENQEDFHHDNKYQTIQFLSKYNWGP